MEPFELHTASIYGSVASASSPLASSSSSLLPPQIPPHEHLSSGPLHSDMNLSVLLDSDLALPDPSEPASSSSSSSPPSPSLPSISTLPTSSPSPITPNASMTSSSGPQSQPASPSPSPPTPTPMVAFPALPKGELVSSETALAEYIVECMEISVEAMSPFVKRARTSAGGIEAGSRPFSRARGSDDEGQDGDENDRGEDAEDEDVEEEEEVDGTERKMNVLRGFIARLKYELEMNDQVKRKMLEVQKEMDDAIKLFNSEAVKVEISTGIVVEPFKPRCIFDFYPDISESKTTDSEDVHALKNDEPATGDSEDVFAHIAKKIDTIAGNLKHARDMKAKVILEYEELVAMMITACHRLEAMRLS